MAVVPTSTLVRGYISEYNPAMYPTGGNYSPAFYKRKYSNINISPRRVETPAMGSEVKEQIRVLPRSPLSMDRTYLSSDRQVYSRALPQPPIDKVMNQARLTVSILNLSAKPLGIL